MQALFFEEIDQLGLFLDAVVVVEGNRSLGGCVDFLLLRGVHGVVALAGDGNKDTVSQVAGQHDLLGHFIELGSTHRGQGVVLAVHGAGFQAQVDLAKSQRGGCGAQGFAQEQPLFGAGHAQLDAFEVGRGFDIAHFTQIDLAAAQVANAQNLHIHFLGHRLVHLGADRAVEHLLLVIGVTDQVAGGKN